MDPVDQKVISVEDLETSLEDFNSEATPAGPTPAVAYRPVAAPVAVRVTAPVAERVSTVDSRSGVSLSELLAAGIRVEPFEAVAIVQTLCSLTLESSVNGPPALDLPSLILYASGAVRSTSIGTSEPATAIQGLGRLLGQLLPEKDFMFLRERVVEKATCTPPYYVSLQEFAETLAYYERPDRAVQVRGVFTRWQNRAASAVPPRAKGYLEIGRRFAPVLAACSRYGRVGALTLAGLTVALLAAYVLTRPASVQVPRPRPDLLPVAGPGANGQPPATPATTATTEPPSRAAATPPASDTPQVAARPSEDLPVLGSLGTTERREPTPAPALAPRETPLRPRPGPATRPRTAQPPDAAEARGVNPAPVEGEPRRITLRLTDQVLPGSDIPAPHTPPSTRVDDGLTEGVTYSVANADVIPPVVLYSQLPGPSPLFTPQHDVPALEVVVNEHGTVDSVRAVARPRNIAESVVLTNGLSAAKAWRFRPALKNGLPVRYRLLVALSTD